MNSRSILLTLSALMACLGLFSKGLVSAPEQSHFKLPTSNGLIVSVFNVSTNRIDYAYPHIFANYDSGRFVHPFVGNIRLMTKETPLETHYQKNTHVISTKYKDFTVNYFASFTRQDKVLYIVIRGKQKDIEYLTLEAEMGEGTPVSGIVNQENPWEDANVKVAANTLTGSFLKKYKDDVYDKYFLYAFTDAYHTDKEIIAKTIRVLKQETTSLLDREVDFMQKVFLGCKIPKQLTPRERNVVEQSISIFKMSQVSDAEIFPNSHGQVLASLRPGLWHVAWVRDGAIAIQAMTRLGMYTEARKALEFQLKAPSGKYKHYWYRDGKDYGVGVDYQISLTRYFGNGEEESDYNDFGPNIELDDFGLFLIAYCDYVSRSGDEAFYRKWNTLLCTKVADATLHCIDTNGLIKADSGPWEHHLEMPRQYTFTSGVCARGLELFANLQKKYHLPYKTYEEGASTLKQSILKHMLVDNAFIKGNVNNQLKTDKEYYDAGVYEIFANGLIDNKSLFESHMKEYDQVLRIKGNRPGYIRLQGSDPYENQEWVFIDLRIALAHLLFGEKDKAFDIINFMTDQASVNYNQLPEMLSNKAQVDKVTGDLKGSNFWCNCIRDKDDQYIGMVPMVGYGSGAYILSLYSYYGE